MKFKVTSGLFKKFVHVEMLIDDLEHLFGVLSVQTRTETGFGKVVVYITIRNIEFEKEAPAMIPDFNIHRIDKGRKAENIEDWWSSTDKSGKNYKIEKLEE